MVHGEPDQEPPPDPYYTQDLATAESHDSLRGTLNSWPLSSHVIDALNPRKPVLSVSLPHPGLAQCLAAVPSSVMVALCPQCSRACSWSQVVCEQGRMPTKSGERRQAASFQQWDGWA